MTVDQQTPPSQKLWSQLVARLNLSWRDLSLAGEQLAARRVFTPGLHLIVPVLAVLSALVGYLAFPTTAGTDSWGLVPRHSRHRVHVLDLHSGVSPERGARPLRRL